MNLLSDVTYAIYNVFIIFLIIYILMYVLDLLLNLWTQTTFAYYRTTFQCSRTSQADSVFRLA